MKSIITLFFCLIFFNNTSTQAQTKDMRYKKLAGRYGNTSGIGLFEDGTFLLYGYATAVFGKYHFEKDYLLFYPDQRNLFDVYANKNPTIGDSTRINFIGFEEGNKTFVQFDQNSIQQVFNDDANCFDAPFVYQKAGLAKNIILSQLLEESGASKAANESSWHYRNDSGYNDFIMIYKKPKREYENFSGTITTTKTGENIRLSNYGGREGYSRHPLNEEEQKQWQELLDWKKQYDQSKEVPQNMVYANKHYRTFPKPDAPEYHYDSKSNLYTATDDQENSAYYKQNQYKDPRYLRKYVKIEPATKDTFKLKDHKLAAKSIFFSSCDKDSEHSYHYNGYEKYVEEE